MLPAASSLPDLSRWAQHSFWGGLIAGRLVYVFQHAESYRHDLLSVLFFWQPGYSLPAAVTVSALITGWYFRRLTSLLAASGWLISCLLLWIGLNSFAPLSTSGEQQMPPLTLPTLEQDGVSAKAVQLDQLQGRVILNLWASWCGPCRREMPSLVRFAADHPQVQVWLVNQGESPQMVRRFIETQDEPIPENLILLDPNQSLMQAVQGAGLPITLSYLEGKLVDSHIGELNHARLREIATTGN